MAKYKKGGTAIFDDYPVLEKKETGNRRIKNPALRDHRLYSEVLMGKRTEPKRRMGEVRPFPSISLLMSQRTGIWER